MAWSGRRSIAYRFLAMYMSCEMAVTHKEPGVSACEHASRLQDLRARPNSPARRALFATFSGVAYRTSRRCSTDAGSLGSRCSRRRRCPCASRAGARNADPGRLCASGRASRDHRESADSIVPHFGGIRTYRRASLYWGPSFSSSARTQSEMQGIAARGGQRSAHARLASFSQESPPLA